ncbi:MAG: hypothetical protein GXY48_11925 [Methanomicrobiales archaeon]|nr:hypothetical protein [Methanomicrobiales archaeon]
MRFLSAGMILLFTIIIFYSILPVTAVPPLPAEYYGNVLIDGVPAPAGTIITAFLQGISRDQLTTSIDGFYGGPGLFDPRLKVNVTEEEFQTDDMVVSFKINGIPASESIMFEPGTAQQFDISTGSGSSFIAGPGSTPIPVQTIQVNGGSADNYSTPLMDDQSGVKWSEPSQADTASSASSIRYGLERDEKFTSDDGMASIEFKRDTLLFSPSGTFLDDISILSRDITTLLPVNTDNSLLFTGYAYEITPERTYFNPEGVFLFHIPIERISEISSHNPQILTYNPQLSNWNTLKTSSNQFTSSIYTNIYEAGIYALFIESEKNSNASTGEESYNNVSALPPVAGQEQVLPSPQEIKPQYHTEIIQEQNPVYSPAEPENQAISVNQPASTPEQTISDVSITPQQTPVITSEPAVTREEVKQIDILKLVKNSLSGPVGLITALVILTLLVNIIAYFVYNRFWMDKNR